jgi:hypothetical protein
MKNDISTISGLSEWDSSTFLGKWTFSAVNPLLNLGLTKTIQFEDLMEIPSDDASSKLMIILKENYRTSTSFLFIPRLMIALFKTTWYKLIVSVILTIVESIIRILLPVILIFLLRALQNHDSLRNCYMWAAILGGFGIAQTIVHHILFYQSMTMGWNWKSACTALIHDHLFNLSGGSMQNTITSTGMLVNLISNDVTRFEEFAVVNYSDIIKFLRIFYVYFLPSMPSFLGKPSSKSQPF